MLFSTDYLYIVLLIENLYQQFVLCFSSEASNAGKLMKPRGFRPSISIVQRFLEILMKHEAQVDVRYLNRGDHNYENLVDEIFYE